MPNQPVLRAKDSDWIISSMLPGHVSLLASWIGFLDPTNKIDIVALETQLSKEINDIEGTIEHYVGFFQDLPVFYMAARRMHLSKSYKMLKTTGPKVGYEISTLLINPVIEQSMIFQVYHQAIKYIFESFHVLRIIIPVELHHQVEIDALKAIGFNSITFGDTAAHYQWFGCRILDFVAF
jgi:hypothetical protein